MSEIKNVNQYQEVIDDGSTKDVNLTPLQQLKHTLSDARDKVITKTNDGIKWVVENPEKAAATATLAFVAYTKFVRPIASDILKIKAAHTYEFYDFKNHESLRLRRKLTDRENKELILYLSDMTVHNFASDWLRAHNLLK